MIDEHADPEIDNESLLWPEKCGSPSSFVQGDTIRESFIEELTTEARRREPLISMLFLTMQKENTFPKTITGIPTTPQKSVN
jgi:hypothetical protein